MTPFMSLVVPVLVSAVAVFLLSSIIHMATPWHKGDFEPVPDEDRFMDAIRALNIKPGDYSAPNAWLQDGSKNPEFMNRFTRGPTTYFTVLPSGPFNMGKTMGLWFAFTVLVAAITACVTGSIVGPGGDDHDIFHYAAIITFVSYALGSFPLSIWYNRKWSTAFKGAVDSALYALATGFIFSMMWPKT